MKISNDTALIGAAALAGLGLIWWVTRPGNAAKLAQGAVGLAGEAATGTVIGLGKAVGVPETNQAQCQKDLAAGAWWAASFSCPASDYLGAAYGAATRPFTSTTLSDAEANDARRAFAATDPRRIDVPSDPLQNEQGYDFRYF